MPLIVEPEVQWYLDNHLTHQLHTSERRAFRSCRRRWNWVYRDMYSPQVQAAPLEFGIAFHKAMEAFYDPRTWGQDNTAMTHVARMTFKRECEAQLEAYKKNFDPDPDAAVLIEYKERIELGMNMVKYYCGTMSPIYDRGWTPVRVEVGFEVPIKNPDNGLQLWCNCSQCWKRVERAKAKLASRQLGKTEFGSKIIMDPETEKWKGLPVTYGGRLDALFQDKQGFYWIADWKTTSRLLDEDQESSFLQLDDQIASYLWALSEYGIWCKGFVYVEIKKAFPQPPELLSRKFKGRSYSTNKQALTTYEMAKDVFSVNDNDAWQMGLYDDYLKFLSGTEGPRFTQRHQVHKNQNEIIAIGDAIAQEAMEMIGTPRVYPMPGRFSCNWCLFKTPCLGKNMGEDYQYTLDTMFDRFEQFYWESKDASTD